MFANDCLPRIRGKVKSPSRLLKSKPKSKSYSSMGYSCPESERSNLMSSQSRKSTSRGLFSPVLLIPETQHGSKIQETNIYRDKSNLSMNLAKIRKVKSLPELNRSVSAPDGLQDLQIEAKTDLRSYEPLEAQGQKVIEEDKGKSETMDDSDFQRVVQEILNTTYGLHSLKTGSEVHGGLTDISEIFTLLKMKGLVTQCTIRNDLHKRGLVVSDEHLALHLELLSKPKNLGNSRAG